MKMRNRNGFTLVDVMVGTLVLTTLIVGGGAAVSRARVMIAVQGDRRLAVELANRRIERIRTESIDHLAKEGLSSTVKYLSYDDTGSFSISNTDPGEEQALNNARTMPMITRVREVTLPVRQGMSAGAKSVEIDVEVFYRSDGTNRVIAGNSVRQMTYFGRGG